jgi:hypothetical protein
MKRKIAVLLLFLSVSAGAGTVTVMGTGGAFHAKRQVTKWFYRVTGGGSSETDREPTLARAGGLSATVREDVIIIKWKTASQLSAEGFYVLRSENSKTGVVRRSVFVPVRGGPHSGTSYTYRDTALSAGNRYFYWLETLTSDGGTYLTGPAVIGPDLKEQKVERELTRTRAHEQRGTF